MSTNEGKCVLVEVGALISCCIYSYRIVMLLVPYLWASMTFLPKYALEPSNWTSLGSGKTMVLLNAEFSL